MTEGTQQKARTVQPSTKAPDEHDPVPLDAGKNSPSNIRAQADEIVGILSQADPKLKKQLLMSLGASERVVRKTHRNDNRKVLETVRGRGEALRAQESTILRYVKRDDNGYPVQENGLPIYEELTFEGFVPVPPDPVCDKGRGAVIEWAEKWFEGEVISSSSLDFDESYQSVEDIAQDATLQLISG